MAHFAELDENNIVLKVLVTPNDEPDEGYSWLVENLGGTWVKTSYNGNIRKNYASIGFYYDEELDAFIPPKPLNSWILNPETCNWQPPTESPDSTLPYFWDEDSLSWKLPQKV
jgi:hypothetical protein